MKLLLSAFLSLAIAPWVLAAPPTCKECKPCAEHHAKCKDCKHDTCKSCKAHHEKCKCAPEKKAPPQNDPPK